MRWTPHSRSLRTMKSATSSDMRHSSPANAIVDGGAFSALPRVEPRVPDDDRDGGRGVAGAEDADRLAALEFGRRAVRPAGDVALGGRPAASADRLMLFHRRPIHVAGTRVRQT